MIPLPPGPFGTAIIDPARLWIGWSKKGEGKSPQQHYRSCPPLEETMALPLADIMAPNSALFLWATWPLIFNGPEALMKAWGFRYSGLAWTWIKFNPVTGKYAFGLGKTTRKNVEPCLLGLRGHPKLMSRSVRDIILAPRREHSRKPDQQYDNVEAMYPGPHVELFARYPRPGWTQWGDEISVSRPEEEETHVDQLSHDAL